jgi:hypothetical protein
VQDQIRKGALYLNAPIKCERHKVADFEKKNQFVTKHCDYNETGGHSREFLIKKSDYFISNTYPKIYVFIYFVSTR